MNFLIAQWVTNENCRRTRYVPLTFSFAIDAAIGDLLYPGEAQLFTHNVTFLVVPLVVTDVTPAALMPYLHVT